MKRIIGSLILALCVSAGLSATASAQASLLNYDKLGTSPVGEMMTVWNTTDSAIVDGSIVVIDTTASIKRIGVRNYIQNNRFRVLGIAAGEIPKSSKGSPGKVLIRGYHPRALVGASNVAAATTLKISLSVNGSFSAADTVGGVSAWVLGSNAGVYPGVRYKYKVWFLGPRVAGATL